MMLTSEEKEFLDHNGYLVISNILSEQQCEGIRSRLDELEMREGLSAGSVRPAYQLRNLQPDAGTREIGSTATYTVVLRIVKAISNRLIFRFAPSFKAQLQRPSDQSDAPETLWQSIQFEFRQMMHAAASQECGALRICDLVNKGAVFDPCFTDGRVLAAVGHVIAAEFKLSSLNYRAAEPGGGLQPLHIDWFEAWSSGQVAACNTLWVLDDFTNINGATRVVPGSHRNALSPEEVVHDVHESHPQETLILAKTGSVVIMNGQLWHGGTQNKSQRRRRVIQGYFVGRNVCPQLDQQSRITYETLARLDTTAKAVLQVT